MYYPHIIVGISLLAILAGIGFGYSQHTWLREALITSGEVIELVEKEDPEGSSTYSPKVRYTNYNGRVREFTTSASSNPSGFKVGEIVLCAYSSDGGRESILTIVQCYGGSILAVALGIAGLLVGFAFMAGPKIISIIYLSK